MQHKKKGSNAERELLFMLYDKGFATARVAGSGSSTLPTPDIIAIRNNIGFAIECKTKAGEYLNIRPEQITELETWEKLSKNKAFVAWRLGKNEWYFLHYTKMNKTKKAYSIKREEIKEKGMNFDKFTKI
jgi:Holliday junction resolvase